MRIALTTTVPLEPLFAGGHTPVDLNNIFINDKYPRAFVDKAHEAGFPRSLCAWIKAQHTVLTLENFDAVIAVSTGDCSNTNALMELVSDRGGRVHNFSYIREPGTFRREFEKFCAFLGVSIKEAEDEFRRLLPLRKKLASLDALTVAGFVTGEENHSWLVSSSDFWGDKERFDRELSVFLSEAEKRSAFCPPVRLGFVGVPPIITDLYKQVRELGADFFFNEVQHQFMIPSECPDMLGRYLDYTYPYDIFGRLEDITTAVRERKLHGIVHYVQSFCHRQIQDMILRKRLSVPVLTLEGDGPAPLDERSKIRLESFVEMLAAKNGEC